MTASELVRSVVAKAAAQDPSINGVAAHELAAYCLLAAESQPGADAAEIARRCVAQHPEADASWVIHLARAAVAAK